MNPMKNKLNRTKAGKKLWCITVLSATFVGTAVLLLAQSSSNGVARTLEETKTTKNDASKCDEYAVENGDPNKGPFTGLLKAAPGCVVPKHYHTAEEQMMVVRGEVLTGMDGMQEKVLGPGGFAMIPSKAVHWLTCTSKTECVVFETFDRRFDIGWVTEKK